MGYQLRSQRRTVQAAVLGLLALFSGCNSYDEDFFPYRMRGLNAYLYDLDADREIYLGFMEASYRNREQALAQCQKVAWSQANALQLENWGYICCTVTADSQCATKVK